MLSKLLKCCGGKKEQKSEVEMKNETFENLQRKKNLADKDERKGKKKNQFINGFNVSVFFLL